MIQLYSDWKTVVLGLLGVVVASMLPFGRLAAAPNLYGQIVSIKDGDTLTLLDPEKVQHTIRLAEIDAPEVAHGKGKPTQPYGEASRKSLAEMCFSQSATVVLVGTDIHQRLLGHVECNGVRANLEQVRRGLAWVYVKYARSPEMFAAERDARLARRGLWVDLNPVEPWLWRKKYLSQVKEAR